MDARRPRAPWRPRVRAAGAPVSTAQLPQPGFTEAEGMPDLVAEHLADPIGDLLPRAAHLQYRDPVQLDPIGQAAGDPPAPLGKRDTVELTQQQSGPAPVGGRPVVHHDRDSPHRPLYPRRHPGQRLVAMAGLTPDRAQLGASSRIACQPRRWTERFLVAFLTDGTRRGVTGA
jgi:hypothetical protein